MVYRWYTKATWQASVHSENIWHPLTKRDKRGVPVHVGVSDYETANGENARMHKTNTYANAMHMMTWYEMHDMNKMQNEENTQPRRESHNLKPEIARVGLTNMASYIRGVIVS